MEPHQPTRTIDRRLTVALVFLGVLALLSAIAAIAIVVLDGPDGRQQQAARDRAGTGTRADLSNISSTPPVSQPPTRDHQAPAAAGTPAGGGHHAPKPAGPQIVYFRVQQQPRCDTAGNHTPATVQWKLSGATGAALSVDNPGVVGSYRSYTGTTGTETLNFSCGGGPGSTETHVYTLYTVGGGKQRSQTINVSATVPGAPPSPAASTTP
ncbi:hypothetical protein [Couchioplanes azureus]|uniref:hypothetical protein n=1 Tax=Couchioplanes caeruleus TaxID=56438 RepID=UPI0016715FE7|nr:hypothetical protein [Couchioplanes caeruleus]GGQ76982.1 hypothetical protein GCM10010166_53650 [Couchioplanes caeruleus subsp. azureus]